MAVYWLPKIIREFQKDYPHVEIEITEGGSNTIETIMANREADLCIYAGGEGKDFEWIPLCEDRMLALVPPGHSLAEAEQVPLEAFLKDDARGFVNHLPEDTRNEFDIKKFNDTRTYITKTLGTPVAYQYLTTLKFVTLSPHIWKIEFERKDRKGEIIRSEALFRIITGQTGPEKKDVSVIGFNFL